jgi:hypothetical protein
MSEQKSKPLNRLYKYPNGSVLDMGKIECICGEYIYLGSKIISKGTSNDAIKEMKKLKLALHEYWLLSSKPISEIYTTGAPTFILDLSKIIYINPNFPKIFNVPQDYKYSGVFLSYDAYAIINLPRDSTLLVKRAWEQYHLQLAESGEGIEPGEVA